ncbi:MAG: hypothetical protein ACKOPS_26365 [Cyanobium sp.]
MTQSTINATQHVVVSTIRDKACQWEQESSDAALSNAPMLEQWAFDADLLAGMVSSELTALFFMRGFGGRSWAGHLFW